MTAFEEYNHFFSVKVERFDGPIDLLLHLVKSRELPIEELSLAQVAAQYLECIESLRHVDLDVAGEYLVIAATLISIKAAVLLNEPVELVPDEEGNLINPHDELLLRLREAEVYKQGAELLLKRDYLGIDVFSPPSVLKHLPAPAAAPLLPHSPMLLGKVFRKLLEKVDDGASLYTVMVESVSVIERMVQILDLLEAADGPVEFERLIPNVINSRGMLIASFVALLELCKRQAIYVSQSETFEQIFVGLAADKIDLSQLSSEFDEPQQGMQEAGLAANLN
ncbi:MAG: segregation/condensation protein A [Deltaproteobacteria bacterium]|nr:segregation/condensation protein A [Deltaproteobacteria bacterium]